MLHLMKLAVGARDLAELQAWQAARLRDDPPLRHQTRNMPRRAAEVLEGGSIYWVIGGAMLARQRVVAIAPATWDDGGACARLDLDPVLVRVAARPVRPFQGWRYLPAEDAPPDLTAVDAESARGAAALPPALLRELRALCLI